MYFIIKAICIFMYFLEKLHYIFCLIQSFQLQFTFLKDNTTCYKAKVFNYNLIIFYRKLICISLNKAYKNFISFYQLADELYLKVYWYQDIKFEIVNKFSHWKLKISHVSNLKEIDKNWQKFVFKLMRGC